MKKKSLLILPVLLLALAACNNEEEETVEENPGVTENEGTGENEGAGGTGTGEGEGGGEVVVDTRITLTDGEVVLNEVDEGETPVTYANPSDDSLSIDKGVVGEDGSITYTVTGTAPTLSAEQAEDFWSGHAEEGDKYIIINVAFNEDEAVSWVSSAGDTRVRTIEDYPDGSMDVIIRITGKDVSEDKQEGTATYTIGEVPEEGADVTGVKHIVDFSALFDTRITLPTESVELDDNGNKASFQNESDLAIVGVKQSTAADGSVSVTYTITGSASVMDDTQATVFWNGTAAAGDKYIIVTIALEAGETASWIASDGQEKTAEPSSEDIVIRISGTGVSSEKLAGTATYTITGTDEVSVSHIVDFSALLPVDDGGNDA